MPEGYKGAYAHPHKSERDRRQRERSSAGRFQLLSGHLKDLDRLSGVGGPVAVEIIRSAAPNAVHVIARDHSHHAQQRNREMPEKESVSQQASQPDPDLAQKENPEPSQEQERQMTLRVRPLMEARQMKVLNVLVNPFIENARGAKMLEEGELQQVVSKFPHFGSTIYEECGQNNVDAPLRPVGRVSDENIIMANRRATDPCEYTHEKLGDQREQKSQNAPTHQHRERPRTSQEESLSPGEASGLEKNLYTLGDGKRGVLRDQVSGSSSSKWEPEETDSESESG
ncbi:23089_t:CDS:2 [Rhizophagus irregularis]|nr:23089_t:CDS:2 [Rhizophagus irregularis]